MDLMIIEPTICPDRTAAGTLILMSAPGNMYRNTVPPTAPTAAAPSVTSGSGGIPVMMQETRSAQSAVAAPTVGPKMNPARNTGRFSNVSLRGPVPKMLFARKASTRLAAASLVLAFLAKSIFGTGPLRLTFENLPVFLAGFIFGPTVGAATALCADLVSCIITGMPPLPLVTLGAAAVGAVGGTVFRYILPGADIRISVPAAVLSGHIVGSMIIKSIGLYAWFGNAVYLRIPVYIGIAAAESVLLVLLLRNRTFMAQVGKVVKRK